MGQLSIEVECFLMKNNRPAGDSEKEWMKHLPFLAATIVGLTYFCGFLVDNTYNQALGIREAGWELLRARYLYTGFLCLYFPVSVAIVFLGGVHLYKRQFPVYLSSILLVIALLCDFYILIAFGEPGFTHEHSPLIALLFGPPLIYLSLLRQREDRNGVSFGCPIRLGVLKRHFLLLYVITLSIITFWPLTPIAFEFLTQCGWLYPLFLLSGCSILWWLISSRIVGAMLVVSLVLPVTLLYLTVMVFSYRVLPFIPTAKGGRDYSRGTSKTVFFYDEEEIFPEEIVAQKGITIALTVLEETPTRYYVAAGTDQLTREKWRKTGAGNRPNPIYSIKRDIVNSTVASP